ncbi:TnsD family Tn7-like transposition protein [Pseudomonas fontis]|uniref:TnsD family transposase n=1 Tax=Pseudomonas fontis TaxID=2942633 RepID=A0ABT5NY39_9PSED|nr:TnsD family Tn7-like transposition protein [Pseudomonas fontis]MDD0976459.1 TnsD family transposase [Pseudomonas fontis]MDD0993104.1 TnsD family transposase [Pseudomonas fontis]
MGTKLHFFPTAFPDETLHSLVSRYVRLCGVRSWHGAFAGAKSAPAFSQNAPFPSRLGDLADMLPTCTELSVAEMIGRHTLLPYFAPFLSQNQVEHACASMAGDGRGLMLKLGVNASRVEFASRVRFCEACVAQDQVEGGVAYWHRVHLLPGVLVCPYHGTLLRVLDFRWSSRISWQLNLPDDESVRAHALDLDIPPHFVPALHDIAVRSQQVLQSGASALSQSAVRSKLLQGVAEFHLASKALRLHLEQLAQHMVCYCAGLPRACEFSVLVESCEGVPTSWVTKLLRKPRGSHHPLKYILLASALRIDMADVLGVGRLVEPEAAPVPKNRVNLPASDPAAIPVKVLDGSAVIVWTRALTGADARMIAVELGVSLSYVYRAIREIPGGPEAWKEARWRKTRDEKRTAFEIDYRDHKAHACRGYAWLYRCDRTWLSEYTAKHSAGHAPRVNSAQVFAALDAQLAEAVGLCAKALRALPGKPAWISRTRIGRELHALSRFEKQLTKLPLCALVLRKVCESSEVFHKRRLRWARLKLISEGKPISKSSLYRMASIRQ